MKVKNWKVKQKVAAVLILLVLVISCAAYSVYVPELREWKDLQNRLQTAEQTHVALQKINKPLPVTDTAKRTLAQEVPPVLDQSRFIEQLRSDETKSGVVIQSLSFLGSSKQKANGSQAKTGTATTKPAGRTTAVKKTPAEATNLLQEVDGKMSFEGSYSQVREFIRQMSQIPRLVTYKTWSFSTKQVPVAGSNTPSAPTVQPPVPSAGPPSGSKQSEGLPANQTKSTLSDDVLTDPLLKDRSSLLSLLQSQAAVVAPSVTPVAMQTIVTVHVEFAIYEAPSAGGILPKPDEINTYEPAHRANPVETK